MSLLNMIFRYLETITDENHYNSKMKLLNPQGCFYTNNSKISVLFYS